MGFRKTARARTRHWGDDVSQPDLTSGGALLRVPQMMDIIDWANRSCATYLPSQLPAVSEGSGQSLRYLILGRSAHPRLMQVTLSQVRYNTSLTLHIARSQRTAAM